MTVSIDMLSRVQCKKTAAALVSLINAAQKVPTLNSTDIICCFRRTSTAYFIGKYIY